MSEAKFGEPWARSEYGHGERIADDYGDVVSAAGPVMDSTDQHALRRIYDLYQKLYESEAK